MDAQNLKKLRDAVDSSRKKLGRFRDEEVDALRQYVGQHYGDGGSYDPIPVNMMEIAVTTLIQQLAAKEPQVLALSKRQDIQSTLADTELAINQKLIEMDFGEELRMFVMSALFSVGIMKVGIDSVMTFEMDDEWLTETDVFAQHVPFADWVHDTTAKKWDPRQVQFCGHSYRRPLDWARDNAAFDEKARETLSSDKNRILQSSNSDTGTVAHGADPVDDNGEFVPYVDLWDIWIPGEQRMVTYGHSGTEVLADRVISGRKGQSPYHLLYFNPVLNNVMPLPPVMNWVDAHDLENKMLVKLGEQASRQKTVTYALPAAIDDANTIIKSEDGDTIAVQNPQGVKEVRYGGPDQQVLGFAGWMRDLTSYAMGNLDAMAGLGSDADTLGQERLIKNSSNARLQAMQSQVLKSVREIVRDVFWWMWRSPTIHMEIVDSIPGTDISVESSWPIQQDEFGFEIDIRDGVDIDLYTLDIEPYSMQDKSPQQRVQELVQIWQNIIMPGMQMGAVTGDIDKLLQMIAKYSDLPEQADIVSMNVMPPPAAGGGGPSMAMPRQPTEYIRHNVSNGPSRAGAERMMASMAMGAGSPGQQVG